jgi:hypothetical protein
MSTQIPWQTNEASGLKKFGAWIGFTFLLFFLFVSIPLGLSVILGINPERPFMSGVIAMGLSIGAIYAMVKLLPILRTPGNFKPEVHIYDAHSLGQTFEVRHSKVFARDGQVTFTESKIELSGQVNASIWLQLGVVVVVTIIPLIIFKVGLGLIPALFIASRIGKHDELYLFGYDAIAEMQLQGRTVTIRISPPDKPGRFKFTVANHDGERLYREIYAKYLHAVEQWQNYLQALVKSVPSGTATTEKSSWGKRLGNL